MAANQKDKVDRPVEIEVDATGSITIRPTSLHVTPGQSIGWKVKNDEDARWLVIFEDGAGFVITSEANLKKQGLENFSVHSVEVRKGQAVTATDKKKGAFLYRVALFTKNEIYAVVNCPEVIIK